MVYEQTGDVAGATIPETGAFMTKEAERKTAPLLPYDVTVAENFKMYDSFAYENNRDKTSPMLHTRETGNVLKYYTCTMSDENFRIGIDTPKYLKVVVHPHNN